MIPTFQGLAEGELVYGLSARRLAIKIKNGDIVGAGVDGGRYSAPTAIGAIGYQVKTFTLPSFCSGVTVVHMKGSLQITGLRLNRKQSWVRIRAMPHYKPLAEFELYVDLAETYS